MLSRSTIKWLIDRSISIVNGSLSSGALSAAAAEVGEVADVAAAAAALVIVVALDAGGVRRVAVAVDVVTVLLLADETRAALAVTLAHLAIRHAVDTHAVLYKPHNAHAHDTWSYVRRTKHVTFLQYITCDAWRHVPHKTHTHTHLTRRHLLHKTRDTWHRVQHITRDAWRQRVTYHMRYMTSCVICDRWRNYPAR